MMVIWSVGQRRIQDIRGLQLVVSDREGMSSHLDSVLQPLNSDLDFMVSTLS